MASPNVKNKSDMLYWKKQPRQSFIRAPPAGRQEIHLETLT